MRRCEASKPAAESRKVCVDVDVTNAVKQDNPSPKQLFIYRFS